MNTVIIVAAGSGTRFDPDKPKQFFEIKGKPIVVHSIERFLSAPSIHSIVVVAASGQVDLITSMVSDAAKPIKVVAGGRTRAESVRNGLNAIDPTAAIVAVHDAARPLVAVDDIERTIAAAIRYGAACLVGPVTDTIKSIRGSEIKATLDRSQLRRALTPQAFKTEVLKKAFNGAELSEAVTDECYLVEKLGHPVVFVDCGSPNIKITHPDDLKIAEILIENK